VTVAHFKSPQGELIEVEGAGAHVLVALGWEKVSAKEADKVSEGVETEQAAEAEVETKTPARRGRPKSSSN